MCGGGSRCGIPAGCAGGALGKASVSSGIAVDPIGVACGSSGKAFGSGLSGASTGQLRSWKRQGGAFPMLGGDLERPGRVPTGLGSSCRFPPGGG